MKLEVGDFFVNDDGAVIRVDGCEEFPQAELERGDEFVPFSDSGLNVSVYVGDSIYETTLTLMEMCAKRDFRYYAEDGTPEGFHE